MERVNGKIIKFKIFDISNNHKQLYAVERV